MKLSYRYGGLNLSTWYFRGCPQVPFRYVARHINHPQDISWRRLAFTGVGGAVMGALVFLRNRFLWWPLHPLGFVVGNTLPLASIWFSIFIGWLVKAVLTKYGGAKVFQSARYFFLGLVLGQLVIAAVWLLIDYITGMQGNVLYRF